MIASEQSLKTERKSNMRKIIAAGCLMAAMTLCVGCSSAKDGSKDTTKATTETKMKVQSKYKVPKITAAKKTDQLADAQKGETIVTMKVKGYGEMQFKFFMKKAPLAVKNFVTLASNGYFDGQIFHRVINDFMIQSGDPTGTGTGGESIWGEDFDNEVCEELLPLRGSLCMANSGADTNGSQFFIVQAKADTAKKGLEEGNVELTKKQQALFLDQITAAKKTDQLADAQKGETIVTMKVKGYGEMQFKFFMKKAPLAVKNFVTLASNGYFDGQIFHRVINDFMIQSGDPTGTGTGGESIWGEDFDNEVCEELLPLRGSLCMANSGADTNGSQFFIVQAKADTAKKGLEEGNVELTKKQQALFLDQGGYPSLTGSYTVFGQMINGYDVLDKISGCKTQDNGSGEVSQPVKKVVIEKMTVSNAE